MLIAGHEGTGSDGSKASSYKLLMKELIDY